MTAAIVAAALVGAAMGRALPTKPEAGAASQSVAVQSASSAPQAADTFMYFPSQYVNQATEAEEHIQAF